MLDMKYWWLANASDYNIKLIVNTHCYASCPFEYSSIKIINQWNYAFQISKFTLPDKTENLKFLHTSRFESELYEIIYMASYSSDPKRA